jgi:hypothetical protein
MDEEDLAQETITAFKRALKDGQKLRSATENILVSIERALEKLDDGGDVADSAAIDGAAQDLAAFAHRLVFHAGQINQLQNLSIDME